MFCYKSKYVCGIIDWERSGFYPNYWEFTKATNTVSPMDEPGSCIFLDVSGLKDLIKDDW